MNNDKENELLLKAEEFENAARFDQAVEIYSQLSQSDPASPRFFALKGYAYFCQGKYLEALRDFNFALGIRSDAATTLFYRAQTHEKLQNLDNALADYEASAAISPEADVFVNIALIHRFRKDLTESKKALSRAIELEPEDRTAQELLKRWQDDDSLQ